MKERMQKMSTESDSCPHQSRPEAKGAVGVQTFMRVVDGCLTTEHPTRYPLLEQILSPVNLNAAYRQVMRNKGVAGIDRMDCGRKSSTSIGLVCLNHGASLAEVLKNTGGLQLCGPQSCKPPIFCVLLYPKKHYIRQL